MSITGEGDKKALTWTMRRLFAAVIIADAVVLLVEVVMPRLIVSQVGDPWSMAAISITLVMSCMAAGAWTAGYAKSPRIVLWVSLLVSSVWLAASPLLSGMLAGKIHGSLTAAAWVLLILLGPVCFALGTVTTTVTRCLLDAGAPTGSTVGIVSALGSIAGVIGALLAIFAPLGLPLSIILRIAALSLLLAALLVDRSRRGLFSLLGVSLLVVSLTAVSVAFASECNVRSRNTCMSLVKDGRDTILLIDGVTHSGVSPEGLAYPIFDYIKWMRELIGSAKPATGEPLHVLHVGGGAGSLAAALSEDYPGSQQRILEIDPDVIKVSRSTFKLDSFAGVDIVEADGRAGLETVPTGWADVIVLDAYRGYYVPAHLVTMEYARELARVSNDDSIVVANIIEDERHGFSSALAKSFSAEYPASRLWTEIGDGVQNNVLVMAGRDSLLPSAVPQGTEIADETYWRNLVSTAMLLTDDYSPASRLTGLVGF